MSSFKNRAVSTLLTVTTTVWLAGLAPMASAQTDVQAQINALLAEITKLQAKLTALQGGSSTPATACSFTRSLTVGSTGDDVKCLQNYLKSTGHYTFAGGATGYFGPITKAAVAAWQAANSVSPAVGFFGAISRAKYTALASAVPTPPIVGGGTSTPPVAVAGALVFSLASDNPGGSTVPQSASNVTFTKFRIGGTGTVSSLVAKRVGAGATTDFSNVYLYDGSTRLTSGRSVNSSSHEVNFTGINVAVSGEKVLSVTADIASNAGAGNKNAFRVVSAQVTGSSTTSGLPLVGNEMAISGADAGTLTIAKSGSISNPNIGQVGAQVSQFTLSSAGEDISVKRVSLLYTGSSSKSNLTNFVLKDNTDKVLGTGAGLSAKDLAVVDLTTPLTVLKGETKTLKLYADIGAAAKRNDTVILYLEETTDLFGVGLQYGFGAAVTNSFNSTVANHHELTIQGATLTTTFNGPNTGIVKKNGKDVVLFDFTLAAANNLEVRKLNASVATTGGNLVGDSALTDFKVVDATTGLTIAGPVDIAVASFLTTSGAGYTFTDVFNISAGQSRRLKITADIPNDWDTNDAIRVSLTPFVASQDVKNIDNNTFLAAAEMVPSTVLTGNVQTVNVPTLELSMAGLPTSQSFVKGTSGVSLVGLAFRATADDIKLNSVKVTASSASETDDDMIADIQSLALYNEAGAMVSTIKSLATASASSADATFTNLNYLIPKGSSKVLIVKANLSASAITNNSYTVGIAVATSSNTAGTDVVASDSEGNEPFYTGSASVNMSETINVTVLSSGSMSIVAAPSDGESKAGIVTAGTNGVILGKFNVTASNEILTINKIKLLVNNDSGTGAAATSTAEVSRVYLYDSSAPSTPIGSPTGYTPVGSGSSAGDVIVESLGWTIPKDTTKILIVKADTNTIAAGGSTGRSLYVHVKNADAANEGFEAVGASTVVYANGNGALGKEKVYYKTYPEITASSPGGTVLTSGSNDLIKFTVKNKSSNAQLAWSVISFNVNAASATVPLFGAAATAFTLRDLTTSSNVTIATTATGGTATAGTYILYLTDEEIIAPGGSKDYRITGTVTAPGSNSSISTQLVLRIDTTTASIAKGVAWRSAVSTRVNTGFDAAVDAADAGFVWTDNSATSHVYGGQGTGSAAGTADYANGVYVDTFPSDVFTRQN